MLICLLLLITIFTIYNKFNNYDSEKINYLDLNPKIEQFYSIVDFNIEGKYFYIYLENKNNSSQIIRRYNIKSGKLISEFKLR